jgi:hypothetical protein
VKTLRVCLYLLLVSVLCSLIFLYERRSIVLPWQVQTQQAVYSSLIETGENSLLQAAEFKMKVLFPYDFMEEGDRADWHVLQWYYDNLPEDYLLKSSPSFYPDYVLPEAWKYSSLYSLCRECGINLASDPEFFIVISASVRAGLPFSTNSMQIFPLSEEEEEVQRVALVLPSPEITDIIIEDRSDEDRGFPEVPMTPDQWSRFIRVLGPRFRDLAIREGILEMAEESASLLMKDLFEGAGIDIQTIEFSS